MAVLFRNATIVPMNRKSDEALSFNGSVGVVNNKIEMVSECNGDNFIAMYPDCEVIDLDGKVLMPGLINTHTHIAMSLLRGYIDDVELMDWLNNYIWPWEACADGDDIKVGAELGIAELLLGGTTTFVDMYWSENRVAEAVRDMGVRAVLGCAMLDLNASTAEDDVKNTLEASAGCSRIQVSVAPHAPYTCNKETVKLAVNLSEKYNLPMMVHIAETVDEENIIRDRYGVSPVRYLYDLGALNHNTIGAHCIYMQDGDIELLKECGVAIAHNPQSNQKLSSGVAPITQMASDGVLCTIATDGPCSNNDVDMWEEMRSATFLQKSTTKNPCSLPAYETLQMATVNGAKAIGMEGKLGIIAEGALADLIVIDTYKPHMQPIHNIIANLVYSAKSSDVEYVMVDGKILVRDSKLIDVNLTDIFQRVNNSITKIKAKLNS